jgi:hypothetical protein
MKRAQAGWKNSKHREMKQAMPFYETLQNGVVYAE